MLTRRLAGLVGLAVASWMFWEALRSVLFVLASGSDLANALFSPPTSIMRLAGTALMMLGGMLAILAQRGGAWLFTGGALLFALMTVAMVLSGADRSLWSDEAILAPFLLVIAGVLVFCHRK